MVTKAFLNPSKLLKIAPLKIINTIKVYIPWNAEKYYQQHVKQGIDKKRHRFPNPEFGAFSEPLTVVDSHDRIVLWYLPELLSSKQQVNLFFYLQLLDIHIFKTV